MTNKSAIAGILGALAAGVVIGLLVAPEKGSNTRKRIGEKAGSLADGLAQLWRKKGNGHLEGASQARSASRRSVVTSNI